MGVKELILENNSKKSLIILGTIYVIYLLLTLFVIWESTFFLINFLLATIAFVNQILIKRGFIKNTLRIFLILIILAASSRIGNLGEFLPAPFPLIISLIIIPFSLGGLIFYLFSYSVFYRIIPKQLEDIFFRGGADKILGIKDLTFIGEIGFLFFLGLISLLISTIILVVKEKTAKP